MDHSQLTALAEAALKTKARYDMLGMSNTANLTTDERVNLDVRYRLAENAWRAAERAYQEALASYVKEDVGQ